MKFGPKKISPMGVFEWLIGAELQEEVIQTTEETATEFVIDNVDTIEKNIEEVKKEAEEMVNTLQESTNTIEVVKQQPEILKEEVVKPLEEITKNITIDVPTTNQNITQTLQATDDVQDCDYTDTLCQLNDYVKTNTGYSFGFTFPEFIKTTLQWINDKTQGFINPVSASILVPSIIFIAMSAYMIRKRRVDVKDMVSPELYELIKNNNSALLLIKDMDKMARVFLLNRDNDAILAFVKKLEDSNEIKNFLKKKSSQQKIYIEAFQLECKKTKRQEQIDYLIQQLQEKKKSIKAQIKPVDNEKLETKSVPVNSKKDIIASILAVQGAEKKPAEIDDEHQKRVNEMQQNIVRELSRRTSSKKKT